MQGRTARISRWQAALFAMAAASLLIINNALAAPPAFRVCIDYHCDESTQVELTDRQWLQVRESLPATQTPDQERQQLRQTIALLESRVGEITGTFRDLGGNPPAVSNEPGQLDCISESLNTTTYLQLLNDAGLLRWHQIEARQKRSPWIFNTHWTAVIRDTTDDTHYAVDSWFLDNGQPPYIQELGLWLKSREFEKPSK